MANERFNLSDTTETDIAVNFRYEVVIGLPTETAVSENKLMDEIVGYSVSAELPSAPGEAIEWYMPMGMRNHQAGKRKTKPIQLEFVVPTNTDLAKKSIFYMLEMWGTNCYNLNRGTNIGKAKYCTDAIWIRLITQDDQIAYTFQLLRAQPTEVSYGTMNAEGSELVKVSMTLVYDNYKVYTGGGGSNTGSLLMDGHNASTAYS
jgi:hypothetical protein